VPKHPVVAGTLLRLHVLVAEEELVRLWPDRRLFVLGLALLNVHLVYNMCDNLSSKNNNLLINCSLSCMCDQPNIINRPS
jgi:hypothetical protein